MGNKRIRCVGRSRKKRYRSLRKDLISRTSKSEVPPELANIANELSAIDRNEEITPEHHSDAVFRDSKTNSKCETFSDFTDNDDTQDTVSAKILENYKFKRNYHQLLLLFLIRFLFQYIFTLALI